MYMKKWVLVLLVVLTGCLRPPAEDDKDAPKWASPEDLRVTKDVRVPATETVILVDLSKSNHFREQMFAEVRGAVEKAGVQEEVCVLQISEDSAATSSDPWCRGLLDAFACTHQAIKPSGEYKDATHEKPAYEAAAARIKSEMATCEAELLADQANRKAGAMAGLEAWIKATQPTNKTDIQGALARARGRSHVENAGLTVVVYSDMEDDPLVKRDQPVALDLKGVKVHVRQISSSGGGYKDRQRLWEPLFVGWGMPSLDWQAFYQGEFGPLPVKAAASTDAAQAGVAPGASPAAASPPPTIPTSPSVEGLFRDK